MLTLDYQDGYLAPLIANKEAWETRAIADVAALGSFPAPWADKLAVIRAYILCCIESLADETDVFSAKLKHYQLEFKTALQAAREAASAANASASPLSILTIPLERG